MNKKAFTLVELIIVVIIVGILAAFAIPAYWKAQQKSIAQGASGDIKILLVASQIYARENNGVWPDCTEPAGHGGYQESCNNILRLNLRMAGLSDFFVSTSAFNPPHAIYFRILPNGHVCRYDYEAGWPSPSLHGPSDCPVIQ